MTISLQPGATLAERVQYLFEMRRHEDGRPYSANDVVAASREGAGKATINNIRSGTNANPTRETLLGLALFFRVPISYFYPELDGQQVDPLPGWTPPPQTRSARLRRRRTRTLPGPTRRSGSAE